MNAPSNGLGWLDKILDYTPFPDLAKGRWLASGRPGMQRWIPPWAWRHLRFYGIGHITGGTVAAAAGVVCLAYGVYGWAAFFLAIGALNVAGGSWYLATARSAPAQS